MAATAPATRRVNHGRGHSYLLDGAKVSSVTGVINGGYPKPALVAWAAGTVAEFVAERLEQKDGHVIADTVVTDLRDVARRNRRTLPEKFSRIKIADTLKGVHWDDRDQAANKGTAVHRFAQRLAQGEEVDVPPELVGHVDSYLEFRDEWEPTDELVELVVGSRKHRYMGTLDLLCTIPGLGDRCLIDLKTNRSGPFGETSLQLAPYRYADFYLDPAGVERPMPEIDWVGVVWLRADGYDLYPFDAGEREMRTFLYCQQVAWWRDNVEKTVKGEALVREGVSA